MEPKLWIDIAKARLSVNRRDSEAMAGRCHRDPGMEIRQTPNMSRARLGESPMMTKAMTFSTMQAVSIIPHSFLNRSTSTPAPMLTSPLPLTRMPNSIPVWKVVRLKVLAISVRNTGKPRSYRWATPWPKVKEPRMNPRFCLCPPDACTA